MNRKQTRRLTSLFFSLALPALLVILFSSEACRAQTLKNAPAIEKELSSAETFVLECQLQDAQDAINRAKILMNDLSGVQAAKYNTRIRKLLTSIRVIEDSLVNVNMEILRKHGGDSAFQYMQDVVWAYGVSKEKLERIENTILEEASTVNVAQERDEVAYALSLLESGKPMDPSLDPYIVKTAEMLMQARADSIKRAQKTAHPITEPADTVKKTETKKPETKEPAPEKIAVPEIEEKQAQPSEQQPEQETQVALKQAAEPEVEKPVEEPVQKPNVIAPQPRRSKKTVKKKPEEYTSPSLLARAEATRKHLKKIKENQKSAQRTVVVLYEMIEKGEGQKAMAMFRDRRPFLSKHISPQVFNVLELTLAQTVIDAKKGKSHVTPPPSSSASPEQTAIDRIDAFMRQNKVEAAYREFERHELALKKFMDKKDFKMLKDMVENAYELRTGIKKKKK